MWIKIQTEILAPLPLVWSSWTTPDDIICWNFASDDWCCPRAECQLRDGGKFSYRMEAKDGTMGFDFEGEFISVQTNRKIEFALGDERKVRVSFSEQSGTTTVTEEFEAENVHSAEQQKDGWQCILNNFKKHVESKC